MFNSKPLCLLYRAPHSFCLIDAHINATFPTKFQTTSILNRSSESGKLCRLCFERLGRFFSHQCWLSRSTWVCFDVNVEGSASISRVHIIDTHLLRRERGNRGFSETNELLFVLRKGFCSRATQRRTPQSETQMKKLNRKSYFTNLTPIVCINLIKIALNKATFVSKLCLGFISQAFFLYFLQSSIFLNIFAFYVMLCVSHAPSVYLRYYERTRTVKISL